MLILLFLICRQIKVYHLFFLSTRKLILRMWLFHFLSCLLKVLIVMVAVVFTKRCARYYLPLIIKKTSIKIAMQ